MGTAEAGQQTFNNRISCLPLRGAAYYAKLAMATEGGASNLAFGDASRSRREVKVPPASLTGRQLRGLATTAD